MKNRKLVLNPNGLIGIQQKGVYHNEAFVPDSDYNYTTQPDLRSEISIIRDTSPKSTPSQHQQPPHQETIELKKSISFAACVSLLAAMIGHVSIFISPTAIFKNSGSVGVYLIMWFVGALGNLLQALVILELASMFPACGGIYTYVLEISGPFPAFILLWGYNFLAVGPFWAFLSYTASIYILKIRFRTCDPPDFLVKLLAGWILLTAVALNCVYTRFVMKFQSIMAATKIVTLLLVISGGIFSLSQGGIENFKEPFQNSKTDVGSLVTAILYAIFSYGGWSNMTALSEDMKNYARDLPRAFLLTFLILMATYIMINAAYYATLTPHEMINSSSVALDFTQHIYEPLTPLISIFVAISSIGALTAAILAQPRLLFAAAKFGHTPTIMGMLHERFKTPWLANFTLCIWALVMLFVGETQHLMEILSIFTVYATIKITACHLYYRWKEPDAKRPYKVNISIPVFQLIFNILIMIVVIYSSLNSFVISVYILLVAIPVYWICISWKKKPKNFLEFVDKASIILQKLFNMRVAA